MTKTFRRDDTLRNISVSLKNYINEHDVIVTLLVYNIQFFWRFNHWWFKGMFVETIWF